jgi:hypothetical protein
MLALPMVLLFGAATALLLTTRRIGWLDLLIVGLFGFFLASSGIAHYIAAVFAALGASSSGNGH